MLKKLILPSLVLCFAAIAPAQVPGIKAADGDEAKFRQKALVFLQETAADVGNLRTLENRISFTAELANLLWFEDEKEARAMIESVINDFRQLVMQYDAQINALGPRGDGEEAGPGIMSFLEEPTNRSQIEKKFRMAFSVRQQMASGIAEHDPDLAYSFYEGIGNIVSNPEMRAKMIESDKHFEQQLLVKIAEKDPVKAGRLGRSSLEKGFGYQHVELLKKIYKKDPDKGSEFAAAVLSKVKGENPERKSIGALAGLLAFGDEQLEGSGRKPYSRQELREIAELLARAILDKPEPTEMDEYEMDGMGYVTSGVEHIDSIEKYSPARAAQIRTKFKITAPAGTKRVVVSTTASAVPPPPIAKESPAAQRRRLAAEARERREQELEEIRASTGKTELSKEERAKAAARARQIIAQTPGREAKIAALSLLAGQIASAGDKELASDIMRDAQSLVSPHPKNFRDFLLNWMLAAGYAKADPERAFPILSDLVFRANELIGATVKIGEFIDAGEEAIQDGEVQLGAFSGSMVRGFTGDLGVAEDTVRTLAYADLEKTKALTDRFDRTEVRILAKMIVLRSIFAKKPPVGEEPDAEEVMTTVLQ